jgi:hypothetical protein
MVFLGRFIKGIFRAEKNYSKDAVQLNQYKVEGDINGCTYGYQIEQLKTIICIMTHQ